VLLVDSDRVRGAAHLESVARLGGAGTLLEHAAAAPAWLASRRPVLAVIEAVAAEQRVEDALRTLLAGLRQAGARVVCHGGGLSSWSLPLRSELLLLGASKLLDSDAASFHSDTSRELERVLERHRPLSAEHPLLVQMRQLGLVGQSPAMVQLFQLVQRFAALSELPVLVTGETGTGKELVVSALRRLDPKRAAMPFVPINCAALPKGLAEAELFGHRRGAFSGAEGARLGLIRSADKGTVFLDEIGDLDLQLQAKLLRVLQEQRVLSIGEDRESTIDVRIIAATHRDLPALVRAGQFREDLYYRLAVLALRIPPLRERGPDIGVLAQHFASRGSGSTAAVTPEFVEALSRASFPGNVRQLENVVRSALAQREGERTLELQDVPPEILEEIVAGQHAPPPSSAAVSVTPADTPARATAEAQRLQRLSEALRECERATIESALQASRGNQARAAQLLGISARSVYSKMKKHRLDRGGRSWAG
jgi:transcriptional regulator with GAF, ATPase, and Fis domain